MTWIQELPFTIRILPAAILIACIVAVFVFLTQRPVDGEGVIAEVLSENRSGIAIGLMLTVVALVPSLTVLAGTMAVSVIALFGLRFAPPIDNYIN